MQSKRVGILSMMPEKRLWNASGESANFANLTLTHLFQKVDNILKLLKDNLFVNSNIWREKKIFEQLSKTQFFTGFEIRACFSAVT